MCMDGFHNLHILEYTGREEQLVEAAMFWNDKKIFNLPKYLKARLQKVHEVFPPVVLL